MTRKINRGRRSKPADTGKTVPPTRASAGGSRRSATERHQRQHYNSRKNFKIGRRKPV